MSVDKLLDEMLKKIQAMTPEEALEHHIKSRYLEDPILVDFSACDVPRCPEEYKCESYNMITDKSGNDWFYGNHADEIYVDQHNPNSEGFGGRKLKFKLKDGTVIETENGPWHSNADGLLNATGVDLTNEHLTFGCISLGIEYIKGKMYSNYKNVIYLDDNYINGDYSRIKNLAQEFANKLNTKVYYTQHSRGGSVAHFYEPKKYKFEELERGSFYNINTSFSDRNLIKLMCCGVTKHDCRMRFLKINSDKYDIIDIHTLRYDKLSKYYIKNVTITQHFPDESIVKCCRRFLNIIEN